MGGSHLDQAAAVVNEHAFRLPPPGLRDLVSGYIGFRQAGVERPATGGCRRPS